MKNKITLYELLGLIKDRQAPKKVLINDIVYYLLEDDENYVYSQSSHNIGAWGLFIDKKINISQSLDLEVIILDDKFNVEILNENKIEQIDIDGLTIEESIINIAEKIFELVEEVNKLKKESK